MIMVYVMWQLLVSIVYPGEILSFKV